MENNVSKELNNLRSEETAPLPEPSEIQDSPKTKPQPEGYDLFWIVFVVALSLIPKLIFLFQTNFGIESDEAIVGLMAKHILEKDARPIFYYGQHYLGALESYLVAGAFSIWGISKEALKLTPTIVSVLLVLLTYILARQYTTKFGARVASLLIALPPQSLMIWSTKARGGFIELLVIGSLSCILTVSIWKKISSGKIFLLGLVLGLGWWVNNQIIFYMLASAVLLGAVILWREGVWPAIGAFLVGLSSFLIGGAAFWYANIFERPKFASFYTLFGETAGVVKEETTLIEGLKNFWEITQKHLEGFFEVALPIIIGARRFWSTTDLFPNSSKFALFLGGLTLSFLLFAWIRGRKLEILKGPVSFLFIFFASVCLIFSMSSFGWLSQAPRYLLPLYSVIYVAVGISAVAIKVLFGKYLACLLVACFLLLNLSSNYLASSPKTFKDVNFALNIPGEPFVYKGERVAKDHSELVAWLTSKNVGHVFTNYWIGYRLAFETEEAVTFSRYGQPRSIRIPEYEYLGSIELENKTFVLVPGQAARLKRSFDQRGVLYGEHRVGEYLILQEEEPIVERGEAYTTEDFAISASVGEEFVAELVDGNPGTRWRSAMPQTPGMSLTIDFIKPAKTVTGLDIDTGFWSHDAARALTIEAKDKNGNWCQLYSAPKLDGRKLSIYFEPIDAHALRLTQTSSADLADWSIAELVIYGE